MDGRNVVSGARVGVVTTSYPRDPGDAAGSFVRARVRAIVRGGELVDVLAAGEPAGPDVGAGEADVSVLRVPFALAGVAPLFYGPGAPEALAQGAGAWCQAARFFAGLVSAVRALSPRWSRIESHWLVPSALAVAQAAPGIANTAHAHSGDVALLERLPGGDALARRLLRTGGQIRFVSADLRRRFATLAGTAWRETVLAMPVVPAASDLAELRVPTPGARAAARARLGFDGPTVLGVGRLVPIKGYDVLIRAVARLPATSRPTVVLAGDGPERARLSRLGAACGVALRLPGQVPLSELPDYLVGADLFVHPARRLSDGRTEGMPVAVTEALAAGLPVLAAATGGLGELAGTPGVTLIAPDDPRALAEALARRLDATRR